MKVVEMKPVLSGYVLNLLEEIKNKRGLTYMEEKTLKYLKEVLDSNFEKENKIYENIKDFPIPEELKIKISELKPKDENELQVILYRYTLKKDEIKSLLEKIRE